MNDSQYQRLAKLDHAHLWHPFTPMRQWRQSDPLIIERGEGCELIDSAGRRYIDGVSSLWCNVHGHHVPEIDLAITAQLQKIAHTTLLGLSNPPAIELAARLCAIAPRSGNVTAQDGLASTPSPLAKVFYSDAGATATEVAFKMAVGHWYHRGQPQRDTFVALTGAYHGDTTAAMSIGYSELFHRPYRSMIFHTEFVDPPRVVLPAGSGAEGRPARLVADAQPNLSEPGRPRPRHPHPSPNEEGSVHSNFRDNLRVNFRGWSLEDPVACELAVNEALDALEAKLDALGQRCAAVVVEPLVQGAAGMLMQPDGYLPGVQSLCRKFGTLLIADEVATGFGRTGRMFACDHQNVQPDILCLGKGITGGYLPLAATLATDEIAASFEGELHEFKTLYHGHTYTGNPLACAAALASLDLFEKNDLVAQVQRKAELLARMLDPLRDPAKFAIVKDVRQRGLMLGIELAIPSSSSPIGGGRVGERQTSANADSTNDDIVAASASASASPSGAGGSTLGDFGETLEKHPARRLGYDVCMAARDHGVIIRPLGDVVVLNPPLAITDAQLAKLAQAVIDCIAKEQARG